MMRRRLLLALALCAASLIVFISFPTLTLRAALIGLLAFTTGAALCAYFFLRRAERHAESPLMAILNRSYPPENPSSDNIAPQGKLFETTFNEMREGVLIIDREMRIIAANAAARHVFADKDDKLKLRSLNELTRNPAVGAAFLDALQGAERAGVKVETHNPQRRVYDLRVVPLRSGARRSALGAIGVFFDITRLEQLERVRQEFLSNVSHELRTPLTAILAFTETLADGAMDDPQNNQRFLAIIQKNAARMHTLIDDILELSAIEAGNVAIEIERTPLRSLINDVFATLALKAEMRRIELRNEVREETFVFADARRLEQMLTNLVDNAIKFNREGGAVTIKHEKNPLDCISVADTGEGIASEHLSRLFERFYRVDRARSREIGGTGLGLAIVKHLARLHGGEVTVSSKSGEGSTFTIKLPHRRPKDDTAQNKHAALRL